MQLPHYFIAVPLNKECQQWLSSWQEKLKQYFSYKVWPDPLDLHITLKFLGPVSNEVLQPLIQQLRNQNTSFAFNISIQSLGMFGNPRKPRVLWAGIEENNEELSKLQKKVEFACKEQGFKAENRPYRPHITLGKKWLEQKGERTVTSLHENFQDRMNMIVDAFVIFQIHPSKSPKYEVVELFYLNRGD
ncbi:RNA 2',3'-cyclic phosphodiesterase [Aquibacillus sp. 3ASR75-11]|uniref:RNA 2',3'-cyclic phosphodiesterase n=1 Tax=Terrihalobacillus insolitus TaxID=2950438 RepID=A0A9X3WUC9_9BACI|nr:RNA 2',3'-cyclic phosphodiesterase [Terrihalobacillus insolitus]MDC3415090.1 RNA 2',3'-cyclic phosphodiesterase [Terrihalobacillus insolitus]MDC3426087.1 RNA 2',3'-cyclic phosphodiesterase [Terrihalobacillus insolitus]